MKTSTITRTIVTLLLFTNIVRAQPYSIQATNNQSLQDWTELLPETTPSLSLQEVQASSDFTSLTELSFEPQGLTNYWLKIQLHNALSQGNEDEWVLQLPLSITQAEAFITSDQKETLVLRTGFFVPIDQRDFAPTLKANLIKFRLRPREDLTIFLSVRSDRASIAPEFNVKLVSANKLYHNLQSKRQSTALFIGFCLMMLIYALILRVYSKDETYSYYAIYLVSTAIYVAYVNGDMHDWLIPSWMPHHPGYIYLVKLVSYGGLIGYMFFFRSFLDLDRLLPTWDKIFKYLTWLALPIIVLDAYFILSSNFSYAVSDRITIPYAVIFAGTILVFSVVLYRTGDKKGYFVVAGLCCMGLGILFTMISRLQGADYSVSSFMLAAIFELVIFSIGLAYRQQIISEERQTAHFELEKSHLIQAQEHAEMQRQRELNALKTELYTNITHELRTPLTVIMGMTEMINGHEKEKKLINRNTKSLLRLVNQVMDLSQLEAGRMSLQLEQADVIPFLKYLCESFHSNAEAKEIDIDFQTSTPSLFMDFDEERLQQIVYNLISNALKYTPKGGKVQLIVSMSDLEQRKQLRLEVKDSGRGIPADELAQIFERFYQSRLNYKDQQGGSGVGLALTKQLVQLMSGSINVESQFQKGTSFIVHLPIYQKGLLKESPSPSESSVPNTTEEIPEISITAKLNNQPHLLIIEDNRDVITYIKSCVEGLYNISVALNGKEGVRIALAETPDIILSDVMMPEMDGYEVCKILKEDQRTSHIPIILLTAKAEIDDRLLGLQLGADAYLTKPFHKQELLLRLNKLVELRKLLQQRYLKLGKPEDSDTSPLAEVELLFLQQLREKVLDQIDNTELDVAELSASVNLGPSQTYRKLKALTGLTTVQFIRHVRLEQASQLLLQKNLSVAEVAYAVGFSDPNYFSRIFQQVYGYPPREHK